MRGLILEKPGRVHVGEVPAPAMSDGRVLLRVEACTICGGDLKRYHGHGRGRAEYPLALSGHEYAGTVVEVGRDVRGFRAGDRVAFVFAPWCGQCFACRSGHANFCRHDFDDGAGPRGGGFSQFVAFVPPQQGGGHFLVPPELDLRTAALAEPATCAIGAARRAELAGGEIVAVIGLGGLGQMIAQALAAAGGRVIGIDIDPRKVELARPWCEWVIDSSQSDLVEAVREITGGLGADVVVEVVGRPQTFRQSFELVRLGGRIVIAGVHVDAVDSFEPEWIFRKDLTVVGAKGTQPLLSARGEPLAFDYLRRGLIQAQPLLRYYPLAGAQEAFAAQASGGVPKAGVLPNE